MLNKWVGVALAAMVVVSVCAPTAAAGPYVVQGPFVNPVAGAGIPGPTLVPGKEYTDFPDKNGINGAPAPGQAILWDGAGGVKNGLNYGSDEVDALANNADALFTAVINNQSALLYSVSGSGNISYESVGGVMGVWAVPAQIDQHGVQDIDALELWGPEGVPDANRYSLLGDPGGCAVNNFGGGCLVTSAALSGFLGIAPLDLDGLMVNDLTNQILFSVRPGAVFNGGEIWVFDYVNNQGGFLNHGGHLWNTAWAAANNIGNINALEAASVPEPSALLLFGSALIGLSLVRRLRR